MSASILQLQQGIHKRYACRAMSLRYDYELLTNTVEFSIMKKILSINIIFN